MAIRMRKHDELTVAFPFELKENADGRGSNLSLTVHTISGICGFMGFSTLVAITQRAEKVISQLGAPERRGALVAAG